MGVRLEDLTPGALVGGVAGDASASVVAVRWIGSNSEPRRTRSLPLGTGARGPRNTRFFGVAVVSPDRYARDLTRLSREVIQHLAAVDGAELEIRVEITARHSGGYAEDKVRNVTENARTLKFETYGFEDD